LLADPLLVIDSSTCATPALSRWMARCGTLMPC
jgi:hypothetical protein